jgi:uncharacterized membrane protein
VKHKIRNPKNWITALAILLTVIATIALVSSLAIYAVNNALEIFIDELFKPEFTRQKIAIITYIIASVLFVIGYNKQEEIK